MVRVSLVGRLDSVFLAGAVCVLWLSDDTIWMSDLGCRRS